MIALLLSTRCYGDITIKYHDELNTSNRIWKHITVTYFLFKSIMIVIINVSRVNNMRLDCMMILNDSNKLIIPPPIKLEIFIP